MIVYRFSYNCLYCCDLTLLLLLLLFFLSFGLWNTRGVSFTSFNFEIRTVGFRKAFVCLLEAWHFLGFGLQGLCSGFDEQYTHRPQSSSFLGLPYRILNMNPKKELFWSLWVGTAIWVVGKIMVPLGSRLLYGTYYLRYPKRDHNFDNYPSRDMDHALQKKASARLQVVADSVG